jgi:ribonuclease E
MLIDARHSEETRVTIVKGNRVEEFDYESTNKVQLKGNIYLAKVTRVEPSLQAAFVDYGGNRHGFLAISEIHPDYYQIPVEDRTALLEEEAEIYKGAAADNIEGKNGLDGGASSGAASDDLDDEEIRETIRIRRIKLLKRRYKIQEVIKPKQILLVQIVKEERGNKGAAVTTYLSLAGRYTVLMPNTTHGGGISRKIADMKDRKRLKTVLEGLKMADGMGCIIRTAGMTRTKAEIKRDVDYLIKLWDSIRGLTLKSVAPCVIYEEGNLIKRAIRDLYDRDIEEIMVEGDAGYQAAKEFMKLLVPSHAKKVQPYTDRIPLFHRFQIESQLDGMFQPIVNLKSGGYIVINPTEALIAIDVNSGRATKGHHIEETALRTNLEAADELSRQLRLRDLSGLIVVDFIDMEERKHNRQVENQMRDAIKRDRARIQAGRISSLGLMELSRQRLRPNIVEASTQACPHCQATGYMRTTESSALQVMRAIEEEGIRERTKQITARVPANVAIYILNQKRDHLSEIEARYKLRIEIRPDKALLAPAFEILRLADTEVVEGMTIPIRPDAESPDPIAATPANDPRANTERPARRRRGRRGGRRRGGGKYVQGQGDKAVQATGENTPKAPQSAAQPDKKAAPSRGRKGRTGETAEKTVATMKITDTPAKEREAKVPSRKKPAGSVKATTAAQTRPKPKAASAMTANKTSATKPTAKPAAGAKKTASKTAETKTERPASKKAAAKKSAQTKAPAKKATVKPTTVKGTDAKPAKETAAPKRKGWWQKVVSPADK